MSPIELFHSVQRNNPDHPNIENVASVLYDPYFDRLGDIVLTQKDFHHLLDIYPFNQYPINIE
jgi:hypothetical protein